MPIADPIRDFQSGITLNVLVGDTVDTINGVIFDSFRIQSNSTRIVKNPYTLVETKDESNPYVYLTDKILRNSFRYRYQNFTLPTQAQLDASVLQNPICITESRWNSGNHNEGWYTNGDYTRLQSRSIILKDDGGWSIIRDSSPIGGVKGYEHPLTVGDNTRGLLTELNNGNDDSLVAKTFVRSDPMQFGHNIRHVIERHTVRKVF